MLIDTDNSIKGDHEYVVPDDVWPYDNYDYAMYHFMMVKNICVNYIRCYGCVSLFDLVDMLQIMLPMGYREAFIGWTNESDDIFVVCKKGKSWIIKTINESPLYKEES